MCVAELALSKMHNDRKDRKSREKMISNWSSREQPAPSSTMGGEQKQPTAKPAKPAKPKTKIDTGINIGGQY